MTAQLACVPHPDWSRDTNGMFVGACMTHAWLPLLHVMQQAQNVISSGALKHVQLTHS